MISLHSLSFFRCVASAGLYIFQLWQEEKYSICCNVPNFVKIKFKEWFFSQGFLYYEAVNYECIKKQKFFEIDQELWDHYLSLSQPTESKFFKK